MTDPSALQIFFCKPPVPGRVKTRLASFVGGDFACEIYKHLLSSTLDRFRNREYVLYSADAGGISLFRDLARPGARIEIQEGSDLGSRMAHALFREGRADDAARSVILCGVDIPGYSTDLADESAQLLATNDVVLGPAADGGYYLIGFSAGTMARLASRDDCKNLFAGMTWSEPTVFEEQKRRLAAAGFSIGILPVLSDVDTPDDLLRLRLEYDLPFPDIRAVLPVLNERDTLSGVLSDLVSSRMFNEIICADNGSTDGSVEIAASHGVRITSCLERGYGAACLTALDDIRSRGGCDIVLFLDADGSDDPGALTELLSPVIRGDADMVLGVRAEVPEEPGAVPPHARFGNLLACTLIRIFYRHTYHDLGPFRALRWSALEQMEMDDRNFGWTVQMQVRALQTGARVREVPVRARRRRGGKSKVSTTVRGSFRAGWVIISTIFRELWRNHERRKGEAENIR